MDSKPKVGVIGLGAMGSGMAVCLARKGFQVTGFDIQQKQIERLVQEGGRRADSPRYAAAEADIVVLVVATSQQCSSALFDQDSGAVAGLPPNSVLLLCITASPDYVESLKQQLEESGRPDVRLVDCPISGGEVRAWNGTLSLLCSGAAADIALSQAVLDCLSSRLHIISEHVGAGSKLKLVHQILVGIHILASVEAIGLAYVSGLDLRSVFDHVMASKGASWLFGQRVSHILDEKKVPASSMAIITKDMAMVTQYGRHHKTSLPLSSTAYQIFLQTHSANWGSDDDCMTLNTYLLGKANLQSVRQADRRYSRTNLHIDETTIANMLIGIHAVAALEVLQFSRKLGLGLAVVREVVKDAAGSSVMFDEICVEMQRSSELSLKRIPKFDSILQNLASTVENANSIGYPLFLASMGLQQFCES